MSADLHHLAAAYALDALDDIERQEFERHYPGCDICSAEVAEFRAVANALAASTATEPPAGMKSLVMSEITQTRQLSPLVTETTTTKPSLGFSRRILFAAAAALVVLGGVIITTLPGSNSDPTTEIVASPDAVVTRLDPLTGLAGDLQITWSDERDQVLVVGSRLDDPGVDKAYALWFLVDDGVAPAGLFRPEDGSVSQVLDIDDLDTNGWGITIEPAEGSAQPTTEVIYAGTI